MTSVGLLVLSTVSPTAFVNLTLLSPYQEDIGVERREVKA